MAAVMFWLYRYTHDVTSQYSLAPGHEKSPSQRLSSCGCSCRIEGTIILSRWQRYEEYFLFPRNKHFLTTAPRMCQNPIFAPRMCQNYAPRMCQNPIFAPRMCQNSGLHNKVRARYKVLIYFGGFRIKSTGTSPPPSCGMLVYDGGEVVNGTGKEEVVGELQRKRVTFEEKFYGRELLKGKEKQGRELRS